MSATMPITPGVMNDWVAIAAGQTAAGVSISGISGAIGDYLDGILIIPTTVSCGVVSVLDGSMAVGGNNVFDGGGTTNLVTLVPFYVPIGAKARNSGGWKITTGANVRVIAFGTFS